ncbi:sigma factor binding protein 2, chloroplastic [Lotus japonicus]|uniref:sigma factor binding protein 2, chloroplastic n=1 Tax=Lotus japonicus TaxID=34305 RepID=UPI00258D36B3|nr:sigma factor binding protein 2, chloroplastic [Lotus japonicus]
MSSNSVMMMSSVQQRTPTKRTKPKEKHTKPIKVVYISNPMKIKTSASEFMALVQELTGQDAESPPDPSRFNYDDPNQMVEKIIDHDENDLVDLVVPAPPLDPTYQGHNSNSFESFEPFDDVDDGVFTPQMLENISALLPPTVFYDPHEW